MEEKGQQTENQELFQSFRAIKHITELCLEANLWLRVCFSFKNWTKVYCERHY